MRTPRSASGLRPIAAAALISISALAVSTPARAQAAPPATPPSSPQDDASKAAKGDNTNQLEAIVVTGTAKREGQKKLTTSFSISTANEEQIKEAAPSSTADLLKIVPGVFVETSGGTAGANIEVRGFPTNGDAPYVTMQLDGIPLFPASTLSFLENSSLFRLDDTVARVEVLRGGPSPIWSNGQAGATVNFIQKSGADGDDGSVRLTTGTGSLQRLDLYWGGKVAPDWYLSGGGFYRTTKGVRNTQYPADEGGQVSLKLTHKFTGGEFSVWGRATEERNTFFTAMPLVTNGSKVSAYPTMDALTGALQGNALRRNLIEISPGAQPGTMPIDLADGRGLHSHLLGFDFTKDLGGWSFSNKAGYMSAETPTKAIFTGGAPQTLGSYITSKIGAANGDAAVVAAAGGLATTGSASWAQGGQAITDLNLPVMQAGLWSVDKKVKAFTNDARLHREWGDGHTLSMGLYLASYSSDDRWYLGNSMLMSAATHAQPIDVKLNNGVKVTRNGFDGASFYALDASYNGRSQAVTVADEWRVNKRLRIDGGVRWERQTVDGSIGQPNSGDLDNNPLTIYNNNASYLSGNYKPVNFSASKSAYTVGAGYLLTDQLNTFVRLNSGMRFPNFDDLRDGNGSVERVKQIEVGIKAADRDYHVFLTAFHNTFKGQPQSQILDNGQVLKYLLGSRANGLEFEGAYRPMRALELTLGGNWSKGEYVNSGTYSGNKVVRQPSFQTRFTPSYRFDMPWGHLKAYATYAYIGKRFSDVQNQQELPSYHTLDAGLVAQAGDYEIRLTGTNLSNTLGITEGNVRVIGSGVNGQGVFLGRPIFGRAFELSVAMRF